MTLLYTCMEELPKGGTALMQDVTATKPNSQHYGSTRCSCRAYDTPSTTAITAWGWSYDSHFSSFPVFGWVTGHVLLVTCHVIFHGPPHPLQLTVLDHRPKERRAGRGRRAPKKDFEFLVRWADLPEDESNPLHSCPSLQVLEDWWSKKIDHQL